MSITLTLTLFFVLLALTAFFNLAEMALIEARRSAFQAASEGAASIVLALKKRPGLFLAAIRTGDLVTDLLIGAFVVTAIDHHVSEWLKSVPIIGDYAAIVAGIGAFAIVSYISLVLTDLAPKSIALSSPERFAIMVAHPLNLVILLTRPFLAILEGSNALVLRMLGIQPRGEEIVTQEEVRRILSEGLNAGTLDSFERSMMERILDLDHRSIRTVMTGRPHIQYLRAGMDTRELTASAVHATSSRLLVAEGDNLDKLVGVVPRTDVLAACAQGEPVDLFKMARPATYASDNSSVLSVPETLKSISVHMVIVVDEFGALVGLATLADVLETVAGELSTWDAVKSPTISELRPEPDGSFLIPACQPVDDVSEIIAMNEPLTRRYKTMAGEVGSLAPPEIDPVPLAFVECEAGDRQRLPLCAGLLNPIVSPATGVHAVSHLGDHTLEADLAGLLEHRPPEALA